MGSKIWPDPPLSSNALWQLAPAKNLVKTFEEILLLLKNHSRPLFSNQDSKITDMADEPSEQVRQG